MTAFLGTVRAMASNVLHLRIVRTQSPMARADQAPLLSVWIRRENQNG